jgi:Fe-S oxidoreductase
MDEVMRGVRGRMTADGLAPKELAEGIRVSLETGNNSRITREDFVETVEWLGEELRAATGEEDASLPLDRVGAETLFVPNPREIMHMPMLLVATARALRAAGEDWTLGTGACDVTNWAYYTADPEAERTIARRIVDEAERLRVRRILSTECGHGFKILRSDARDWFPGVHTREVASIAETYAGYVAAGRIRLDPSRNPGPATYHDPCNLARKSGVVEEPRAVLRAAVGELVEMEPNGRLNWCCGGGGGVGQIGARTPDRLKAGRRKVEQIRATGAKVVVTSCQNCYQQLNDLKKEHGECWEVRTIAEVVANALVHG